MTFNHVIADARSGETLLRELLYQHAEPERVLESLPALREPEAYFPWWARGLWRRLVHPLRVLRLVPLIFPRLVRLPPVDRWAPLEERRAALIQLRVEGETLARLKARSEQEGTTVHGALVAALNLACQEEIAPNETVVIAVGHPVDLRARLSEQALTGQVGCLQGMALTLQEVGPGRAFWDLARETKGQLTRHLERGQHVTLLSETISQLRWAQYLLMWGRRGVHRVLRLFEAVQLRGTGLSNIGLAGLAPSYGPVQVKAIEFCAGLSCLSTFGTFAATAGDCLSWNFVPMQPVYTREHAARIAQRTRAFLEAGIEQGPGP